MKHFAVYFDGECSLCCRIGAWLTEEPQIVRLRFIDRRSEPGRANLEGAGLQAGLVDLVVAADDGWVWSGDDAWLMILCALDDFRLWSCRLASPGNRPLLRRLVGLLSRHRIHPGRWLDRSIPSLDGLLGQSGRLREGNGGSLLQDMLLQTGRGMGG